MGYRCAAVYSEADAGAPFVETADIAIPIGPAPAVDSYLRIDRIIDAAKQAEAQLIHPGYGFLAEDAEFAEACDGAGITFVGPPGQVLRLMGSKDAARRLAIDAGVPVLPGIDSESQDDAALLEGAEKLGYPVIVKPAEGGGGKGMAIAHTSFQLERALAAARRVAQSAFGNDRLLIERYLPHARHVEVQIIGDSHGNLIHLGERDCSFQRRHQKVVEEAPAPNLPEELRQGLWDSAVKLGRHSGYENAGTCEFVVGEDGDFGFIETNARLQVEHRVTEQITGVDLVELQIRVATGEALPLTQKDVGFDGSSIEARIYAEDPETDFLPQAGEVLHVRWPESAVTVDTGIVEGTQVSPHYDPLIAKVIVHGSDRNLALSSLRDALENIEVLGVRTNISFLAAATSAAAFVGGEVTTDWLESAPIPAASGIPDEAIALASAAETQRLTSASTRAPDPWLRLGSWRLAGPGAAEVIVRTPDGETTVTVEGSEPFRVGRLSLERIDDSCHGWTVNNERAAAARREDSTFVWWKGRQFEIGIGARLRRAEDTGAAHLEAPMPGQVIRVLVAAGDRVVRGQELVVVEAMKMEHAVRAPADGTVAAVLCATGEQVDRGQALVDFDPA